MGTFILIFCTLARNLMDLQLMQQHIYNSLYMQCSIISWGYWGLWGCW